jgi:hypothetical protein
MKERIENRENYNSYIMDVGLTEHLLKLTTVCFFFFKKNFTLNK